MADRYFINNVLEQTKKDENGNFIGHVPKSQNSGPTVANGFDIGQHNKEDLLKYDFGETINKKLEPALGKNLSNTSAEELDKIANQIILTPEEGERVNENYFNTFVRKTEKEYNNIFKDNKDKGIIDRFKKLSELNQTLLVQHKIVAGNIKKAPSLYKSISKNDIDGILSAVNKYAKGTYNEKRKNDLVNYINDVMLPAEEMYQTSQANRPLESMPDSNLQTLPKPKIDISFGKDVKDIK
jgi:hypothetical protein